MSESSLVTYRDWSPNYYRIANKVNKKITIHHMAGNLSVETCGAVFHRREASAQYGINGKNIGQYVSESNSAWASCSYANDSQSVNIELANDQIGGVWHVSDETIETCIKLCVDVCKRNKIPKLIYNGTTSGTLTIHSMFYATACPGTYLKSKLAYICNEVNKQLEPVPVDPTKLDVDGLFYAASVSKMQKWLGSEVDGEISGQVYSQRSYFPNPAPVCSWGEYGSACIRKLQIYLNKKKIYGTLDLDGLLGKKTVTSLQKFLINDVNSKASITADGIWGTETSKAFQKFLNTR